ncbi:GTP-binding protein [Chlorogloea sp. CCALA 695]|uniref:GTP-binding protein n=1 Tax=Chlorogloea sp. CCALA 695 TaxID=2107693 RepID=UPI000D065E28|nr:GTP-binding protein [Chlorogloea sp. CCALA 695]PSB26527.1 GTPase, G3E family protein [Chlorogloea sp. CCALA 695]
MTRSVITVVAGPPGVGKTTWIRQQMAQSHKQGLYFSPATDSVPIDQTRLAIEVPEVEILVDSHQFQLLALKDEISAYIELGFHVNLAAIGELLDPLSYHCVAIVPPVSKNSEWHQWADQLVVGVPSFVEFAAPVMWRLPLTGQVIDTDSLEVFWYELTQGAYGAVKRAKGIFDVVDGRLLYADFVDGLAQSDFEQLNVSRHLEGQPQRFSGVEVVGENLDESAIAQTLKDCCLSEAAIRHYQQQIKQELAEANL